MKRRIKRSPRDNKDALGIDERIVTPIEGADETGTSRQSLRTLLRTTFK